MGLPATVNAFCADGLGMPRLLSLSNIAAIVLLAQSVITYYVCSFLCSGWQIDDRV